MAPRTSSATTALLLLAAGAPGPPGARCAAFARPRPGEPPPDGPGATRRAAP